MEATVVSLSQMQKSLLRSDFESVFETELMDK